LHDVGSQDGVDYLVMECVEGETLAKRLEKGPLPLEDGRQLLPNPVTSLGLAALCNQWIPTCPFTEAISFFES
jgi:hypothetical protein